MVGRGEGPSSHPEDSSRRHDLDDLIRRGEQIPYDVSLNSGLGELVHADRDFTSVDEFRFSHPDLKLEGEKVLVDLENLYSKYLKNGRSLDVVVKWLSEIEPKVETEEQKRDFNILVLYYNYLVSLEQQGKRFDNRKSERYFRTYNSPRMTPTSQPESVDIGEIKATPLPTSELTDAVMAARAIEAAEPEEKVTWNEQDDYLVQAAIEVNEADIERRQDIDRLRADLPRKQVRRVEESSMDLPREPGSTGRRAKRPRNH